MADEESGIHAYSSHPGSPRAPAAVSRPDSLVVFPTPCRGRLCRTPCALSGLPCRLLLVRDREATGCVPVPEAAFVQRVVQLDFETLASADLALHRKSTAEHRSPRRKPRARVAEAREQIARREHPAYRPFLVEPAPPSARHV